MKSQSMTGFGKAEKSNDEYTIVVEVKSVNHRFRDVRFRMSSLFNSLELRLRKIVSDYFKRGAFDIHVQYKRNDSTRRFDDLDENKIQSFITKMNTISKSSKVPVQFQPCDFLRSEFYKDDNSNRDKVLQELLLDTIEVALQEIKKSRVAEGVKLLEAINEHRDKYTKYFSTIEKLSSEYQESVKEKLEKRFNEFKSNLESVKVDQPRFLQEVVYYLERLDISEEQNRIRAHLDKLNELLETDGEIGRQIDFLIQELNRETNTIGSKSALKEISDSVVQMKVQLEKIREQGLNLE